jgi:DNA-directed RNA polymerase specialized sigma24 family protein
MATRTQKKSAEPLDNYEHLHDETWETEQKQREAAEMTRQLLTQLGEPCQQVVRLHHIDGYSDEEVIQGKMTRYTTADSLKMKRSDCMKKLIQLGAQWRTLINT